MTKTKQPDPRRNLLIAVLSAAFAAGPFGYVLGNSWSYSFEPPTIERVEAFQFMDRTERKWLPYVRVRVTCSAPARIEWDAEFDDKSTASGAPETVATAFDVWLATEQIHEKQVYNSKASGTEASAPGFVHWLKGFEVRCVAPDVQQVDTTPGPVDTPLKEGR